MDTKRSGLGHPQTRSGGGQVLRRFNGRGPPPLSLASLSTPSTPVPEPGLRPRRCGPASGALPPAGAAGGTAWLLELRGGLLLVDCPALTTANLAFLETRRQASGDSGWIVLTSREGHGKVARLRERLPWPVLVQEQEAYLLPNLPGLTPWGREHALTEGLQLLWTPAPRRAPAWSTPSRPPRRRWICSSVAGCWPPRLRASWPPCASPAPSTGAPATQPGGAAAPAAGGLPRLDRLRRRPRGPAGRKAGGGGECPAGFPGRPGGNRRLTGVSPLPRLAEIGCGKRSVVLPSRIGAHTIGALPPHPGGREPPPACQPSTAALRLFPVR